MGLLFYLNLRGDRSNDPKRPSVPCAENMRTIRQLAESSSLEATAWGVAFPDFVRLFFPPAIDDTHDRGWALELDWRKKLGSYETPDDTRLSAGASA